MQLTLIKNENAMRIVHNGRMSSKNYQLTVVHKRVDKPVIQLIASTI
ncbi:hypothetical protein LY01_01792 [Nonlabens xylanidelens]|uniref:Uncharacterized protein n=1 Tax=Nonlabens xylanidelens TaxID=191564 RepID=A0A2S6ILE8_9FLAO|nr:hypothetical protein [Nonlabens xylanidelens]PPK95039.1 hypothetical protein LY01_01792 [Nonlabens xylanidelens]